MTRPQKSRWLLLSLEWSAFLLAGASLFTQSAVAQVVGFPGDEHLAVERRPKTDKELLFELTSARRMVDEHPSAQAALSLGRALKDLGEKEGALRQFDRALEQDPRLSEAWFEKGVITSDQGDWSKAADMFQRALPGSTNSAPAHLELGEMFLRIGDFEKALSELKSVLQLDSKSAGAHQGLGLVYLQQGKLKYAADEFRRALEIQPGSLSIEKHLAQTLAYQHRWAEAAELLRKIAAANPNSVEAASSLATALANIGDKAGAAVQFARARKLSDDEMLLLRAQGDRNWGVSLRSEGKLQDAAAAFRRALRDDESYCDAHEDLGEVLWLQKDFAGAQAEFDAAVRCHPESATARNNLGSVLLYYQHDIDGAIEQFQAALRSRPGFALAHLNLGKAMAAKQDFAGADAELRSAIAINPDFAAAHVNLGLVLAAGRKEISSEARAELEKGVRLDPRLREVIPQPYLAYLH